MNIYFGFLNYFPRFFDLTQGLIIASIALSGALALSLPRRNKKEILLFLLRFIILLGTTLLGSYLSYSLFSDTSYPGLAALTIIIGQLLPSVVWMICLRQNWPFKILKICVFIAIGYLTTEFSHRTNMIFVFNQGVINSSSVGGNIIRALPYLLIFPAIGFILSYFELGNFKKIDGTHLTLGIIVFISVVASSYLESKIEANNNSQNLICFLILGFLMLVNVATYILIYLMIKTNESLMLKEAELKLNESAFLMLKLNEQSIHEASLMRHDLKNHLAFINQLLENKNVEEAKTYALNLTSQFIQKTKVIDCGNATISAIMNLEYSKATLSKVILRYRIAVPSKLPFDDVTLCALLTNVIDNAIEAQEEIEEKERNIDFTLRYTGGMLRLICKNPTKLRYLAPAGFSKKGEGHGYGTAILKRLASTYEGKADFKIENNIFIADLLLNSKEEVND